MPHIHDEYDFTVSAFILHPTENKILLHKHKKLCKWLQPGGHIELDENPWQALTHELKEETGLNLDKCVLLNQPDQPKIKTYDYTTLPIPFHKMVHDFFPDGSHKHIDDSYLIRANTEVISPEENESQKWDWFTREQIIQLKNKDEVFHSTVAITDWIFDNSF